VKLARVSIPYRAFQKVSSLVVAAVFFGTAGPAGTLLAVAGGSVFVLAAIGYELAYYRRFEYTLTGDTFDIDSGVISRRQREIPYSRIQNVDISRNVIQRLLGVSSVSLETAGGSSTEGSIQYVSEQEATRLQSEIRSRKERLKDPARDGPSADASAVGEPDQPDFTRDTAAESLEEEELYAISPEELGLVGALSFDPRLIGLIVLLGSGSLPVLTEYVPVVGAVALAGTALVAGALLLVVSWLLGVVSAVTNYYGFRLTLAGEELRYERGLFRRYSGSIPLEKVQTLSIQDNPPKRWFGYATLAIETAGYGPNDGGSYGTQAAVPIAKRERVLALAQEIETFDEPAFERPPRRARSRYAVRYFIAIGALVAAGFGANRLLELPVPWYLPAGLAVLIPVAAHYKWVHRGYSLGDDHVVTRNGFWKRETKLIPYYRIQNIIDSRSVFQRRWNIGTLNIDTAGTRSITGQAAAVVDFATDTIRQLRNELPERLQTSLAERETPGPAFGPVERASGTVEPSPTAGQDRATETTSGFDFPAYRQQSDGSSPAPGEPDVRTDTGQSDNPAESDEPSEGLPDHDTNGRGDPGHLEDTSLDKASFRAPDIQESDHDETAPSSADERDDDSHTDHRGQDQDQDRDQDQDQD
jgi:Predicted membrane protein